MKGLCWSGSAVGGRSDQQLGVGACLLADWGKGAGSSDGLRSLEGFVTRFSEQRGAFGAQSSQRMQDGEGMATGSFWAFSAPVAASMEKTATLLLGMFAQRSQRPSGVMSRF